MLFKRFNTAVLVKEETLSNKIKPLLVPKNKTNSKNVTLVNSLNQLEESVNKIVKFPDDYLLKLSKMIGFKGSNRKNFDFLLWRNEYQNYWNFLMKNISNKTNRKPLLIDGPAGCGKSTLLQYIVHLWRDLINKPVIYLFNLNKWANGYYPYLPVNNTNDCVYEQRELAIEFIKDVILLNPQLQFRNKLLSEWHREWEEKRALLSPEVITEFLSSLPQDTLFALDGINALYNPSTQYQHPDGTAIKGQQLALFKTLNQLITQKKHHLIGVTNKSDPLNLFKDVNGLEKKYLKLSNLSVQESRVLLGFYQTMGYFMSPVTSEFANLQQFLSGGNPVELLKTCTFENLLFPSK